MKDDCIFCSILAGKAPATFVWQDDRCSAFMDIQPVNEGHVLVVPNNHAAYLSDMSAADAGAVMGVAHKLAHAIRRSGIRCEGVNLFLADGEAAGQEVSHVHLHVFPRFAGDGFGLKFSDRYFQRPPREELEAAADSIRRAVEGL